MTSLYEDPHTPRLNQPTVLARVRALLHDEAARRCASGEASNDGKARGQIAVEWVAWAERTGARVPGAEQKTPLRDGESVASRRVDAARTHIRNVWAGHSRGDWALEGIEDTILAGRGLWVEPASVQLRLVADPPARRGGRCATCGQPLPDLAVKAGDPFCTTDCCRRYHRTDARYLSAEKRAQ